MADCVLSHWLALSSVSEFLERFAHVLCVQDDDLAAWFALGVADAA
jgi:hypothetical protein